MDTDSRVATGVQEAAANRLDGILSATNVEGVTQDDRTLRV